MTVAAKRALGIGDTMLLERRAAQLADGCGIPLAALDLGFYNWERGERATGGMPPGSAAEPALRDSVQAALGASGGAQLRPRARVFACCSRRPRWPQEP